MTENDPLLPPALQYFALTRWGDFHGRPILGHFVEVYRLTEGRISGVARWPCEVGDGAEAHFMARVLNDTFVGKVAPLELSAATDTLLGLRWGILMGAGVVTGGASGVQPFSPLNGVHEPFGTHLAAKLVDQEWDRHPGIALQGGTGQSAPRSVYEKPATAP